MQAVECNLTDLSIYLIKKGANVNVCSKVGNSLFSIALLHKNIEIIECLL